MGDLHDAAVAEMAHEPTASSDMRHLHHDLGHAELPKHDGACENQELLYYIQVYLIASATNGAEFKLLAVQGRAGNGHFHNALCRRTKLSKLALYGSAAKTQDGSPSRFGLRCQTMDGWQIVCA